MSLNFESFWNLAVYEVSYQGCMFTINNFELGDLSREKHNSQEVLTNHVNNMPIHLVKGMLSDMLRYYTQLVEEQSQEVEKAMDSVYRFLKVYTMGQVFPNQERVPMESKKPLSDKLIKVLLNSQDEDDHNLCSDILVYQEAKAELKHLMEIRNKLVISLEIVADTYKTAISLNANERLEWSMSKNFTV